MPSVNSTGNEPGKGQSQPSTDSTAGSNAVPSSDTITTTAAKPNPKFSRFSNIFKNTVLYAATGIALVAIMVFGYFMSNSTLRGVMMNLLRGVTMIKPGVSVDPTNIYSVSQFFPPDKRKSLTVLILGCDHDYGGKRVGGVAVPVEITNTPGRSDSIMLVRYEFDGDSVRSVNVLSIPRDARVRVPGKGIHKINAAHAYGGAELSMATIREVFGIQPDYYVDVNFEGFQQVVDAIGGVDVTVHQQLDYDDEWGHLHVHLKPGFQHLNGYKAMGYVRIRHSDSDLMRAQRQHEFLEALKSRVTSVDTFLKLPTLIDKVSTNIRSNMSMDQLLTLANVTRKAPKDLLTLDTLPVIEGKTYVYINRRKSIEVIRKMFMKDKQLADMTINVPESDQLPSRRRHHRRHDETSHSSPDTLHGNGAQSPDSAPSDGGTTSNNQQPDSGNPGTSDGGSSNSTADQSTGDSSSSGGSKPSSPKGKGDQGTGTTSNDNHHTFILG